RIKTPIVIRAPVGVTGRGAQHSQMMEPFFQCLPGIKIVCPATAYDAKGLLKSAVRDDNPVMIFEHKLLYGAKGARSEPGSVDASSEIPDEEYIIPIGKGTVRRQGTDITIVATLLMMHRTCEAADIVEKEGISAEVIDPRSLVPFDWEIIKQSIAKTGRLMIVEESPRRGGIGAEVAATVAEEMLDFLAAPVKRIAAPDTPAPFSPAMEKFYVPDAMRIVQAIKELMSISS
ncbi:MAG: alpha-ketoacid dehydrogenase subunit beta, partial [Candidatus Ratteibacteria bacterium]